LVPPFTGVAVNETWDPWQKGLGLDTIVTPAGSVDVPVSVREFEVAGFPVTQISDDDNTHVIISPERGM
jgi:hypothetical protein